MFRGSSIQEHCTVCGRLMSFYSSRVGVFFLGHEELPRGSEEAQHMMTLVYL